MSVDRMVLAFAGCVVLLGVALAHFVNPWWIGLSIFAGLNMIQAAFTGFCPAAMVFKKLGAKPGVAFRGPPCASVRPWGPWPRSAFRVWRARCRSPRRSR